MSIPSYVMAALTATSHELLDQGRRVIRHEVHQLLGDPVWKIQVIFADKFGDGSLQVASGNIYPPDMPPSEQKRIEDSGEREWALVHEELVASKLTIESVAIDRASTFYGSKIIH